MQNLLQKRNQILELNVLDPGWSPQLISLNLGICIYAREGHADNKLCLRLISQVVAELEKAKKEEQIYGVR